MARPQNVALVVGLGGAGKTSLIRAVTGSSDARPDVRTSAFKIHSSELSRQEPAWYGIRHYDRCTLHIADYNGQRFDQFFGKIMELQATPKSPVRYGSINSLLFLADLVPPPDMPGDLPRTDSDSINEQLRRTLDFWSASTIDAVFGLTTSSLKYVCFFLNKADLLPNTSTDEARHRVLQRYGTIRSHINRYSEGRLVRAIVGSAFAGDGISQLRSDLITTAYAK